MSIHITFIKYKYNAIFGEKKFFAHKIIIFYGEQSSCKIKKKSCAQSFTNENCDLIVKKNSLNIFSTILRRATRKVLRIATTNFKKSGKTRANFKKRFLHKKLMLLVWCYRLGVIF